MSGEFVPVCGLPVIVLGVGEARGRLRLAEVRAALLLRHRVADDNGRFVCYFAAAEFVLGPFDLLSPDRECGLGLEAGVRGVGHAGRARGPRLDLIPDVGQHGAGVVAVLLVGAPSEVGDLVLPRQRHQFMPARVKVDPVDAVAEAVVGLEFGQMAVGEAGELLHLVVTGDGAERLAAVRGPGRLARDCGAQHGVAGERVEAGGRLGLVQDLVGAVAASGSFERAGRNSLGHGRLRIGFWVPECRDLPANAAELALA